MNLLDKPMSSQAQRERVLNRVIQAIHSSLDLETIFTTAASEIGKFLQVDHVKISEYLPERKIWLTVAHYRSREDLHLSIGEGIPDEGNEVTALLKRLEIFRLDDTNLSDNELSREVAKAFPGAWLILPLHFNSHVWGSLCLLVDGHPHPWQDEEVELASMVASQLAIAIQQSQLHQQVRQLAEAEVFKALQRERELSEAKSRFIAMASHDIRTPLTTIQSSVDLLKRYPEQLSSERWHSHLDRISSAVERMVSMTQDVLILSEASAGKLQLNPTPFDLEQLCRSLVAELLVADSFQHKITYAHTGDGAAALSGTASRSSSEQAPTQYPLDEKLVRYILTNLLSNALKYSLPGSTIRFDLTCHPECVVFRIQDQGIGIPASDIPHLFESFYRASNAGTVQGTGLGLAIVKQCVDLHGGEITVDSVVGEGTMFTVTLPLNL